MRRFPSNLALGSATEGTPRSTPVGPAKLAAAALALALTAAACGSDTDGAANADDNQTDAAVADDTSSDEAAAADSSEAAADSNDSADSSEAAADGNDSADPSDSADEATTPPVWLPAEEAEAAAQQNIGNLQTAEDVRDIQVLSVTDGAVSSLREAVTGDRPVLLWFYAPH